MEIKYWDTILVTNSNPLSPLSFLALAPQEAHRLPKQREWFCKASDEEHVLTLDHCLGNCTGRGLCIKNNHEIRCVCRKVR